MNKIKEYITKNSFNALMDNSRGLDTWSNYSGPSNDRIVVSGIGRNRDTQECDIEASNFEVALEMLGGESSSVKVERYDHWGCGWFEIITLSPRATSKIKIALEITEMLEQYALLDDSDYSEREYKYQQEHAEQHCENLAEALRLHFAIGDDITDDELSSFSYALLIECQRYYGNDCCLNIYEKSEPEDQELERFYECVRQLGSYSQNNAQAFFIEAFNLNGVA